jgi:NADH-quinone oxidoreductase subunit L
VHDLWWLWLIPGLPLLGSVLCGALHLRALAARRASGDPHAGPARLAALIGPGTIAGAFVVSLAGLARLLALAPEQRELLSPAWSWIRAAGLPIEVAMRLDPLSSVMTLVVTGVGALIHVYAVGYMKGDEGFAKFFSFFNLFAAMMLVLVLSSSLLGLFVGWEGVGLCSYLLIGFWYSKMENAEAGQKAFVVNRVGDACFLLGSFLLVTTLGTLDLATLTAATPEAALDPALRSRLSLAALLLFGGACGKSAQIPLFVWLPDAMAGPTPVSALIHAATMVTAGVYLVVRLNPLYALSPELLLLVSTIAAATAFLAASTALVQRDIKRVLAYSTVSQLGYMFLALGSGAWAAAIFHLVTHAFFKALLFLGAGSVIHGMHEEQDMHRMGGLRRHMPTTWATFLAGAGALSGLPLLSGYLSKDEILFDVFSAGGAGRVLWGVGLVTAALTAFYTWRMVALVFHGPERFDHAHAHPHESPRSMTLPLVVLAVLSVLGGALGLPAVLHAPHLLREWLAPVVAPGNELLAAWRGEHEPSHALEWALLALGALIALVFAHKGFHAHAGGVERDQRLARERAPLYAFLYDAWGVDTAYGRFIVRPLRLAALGLALVVDQLLIDGLVNGSAALARGLGRRARRMADGSIAHYGLWMGAAAALIAVLWIFGGTR